MLDRGVELSSKELLGVYDGIYIALAQVLNCEFITADERLVRKMQPKGYPVRSLTTF